MNRAFIEGYVTETGTGIAKILPPTNPFLPESGQKKQTVIDKLKAYFNRFCNLLNDDQFEEENNRFKNISISDEEESSYRMAAEPLG